MRRIAFVVQRYGLEVNGGAELECRQYAERMARYYQVDVLTSKAVDYITWKDEYTEDVEVINGVTVRRFSVDEPRNMKEFDEFSQKVLPLHSLSGEEEWMRRQGPYSEALFSYIRDNREEYDVFIFMTYLYCTTYFGIQLVKDKSILIPTAHDEAPIYLGIFMKMFQMPKGIFYNTEAEKLFVERTFFNGSILNNGGMGGVGVDIPKKRNAERFREKWGNSDFIFYIGRVDEHKGVKELFTYFQEYKKRNPGELKLVVAGKEVIEVPESEDIISLGFIEEQEKYDALAACRLLVLPSRYESLSIVVLEAMAMEKPVLIHGKCEVVLGHCLKSNGGLYYENYFEFQECLNYMLSDEEICRMMGRNGSQYVHDNYRWQVIDKRWRELIEAVALEGVSERAY